MKNIPIHSFLEDDESSIPFQLIRLTKEGSYDTSVPHRNNYYEVFIFEIGGGEHNIDFRQFPICDKSVHFVSPGQVHNVNRQENSKGFVLLFSRDYYTAKHYDLRQFPFLNNNSKEPILNLEAEGFKVLNEFILKIHEELELRDLQSSDLIKNYLNTFLIYCKRFYSKGKEESFYSKNNLTFRFKHLIEESYLEVHNVSEYANILNVSEKQLATATKKEIGQTPKALINERIVLEAKRLVMYTNYTFQEIAFFLNYTDASHFAKFFKSKTGLAPSKFREEGKIYH